MTARNEGDLLYLPIYMAHELGHAARLWHSPGASDAMAAQIGSKTQNINSNDKNAMKALYDGHTAPLTRKAQCGFIHWNGDPLGTSAGISEYALRYCSP